MSVYIIDGIKIEIGAQLIAVHTGGKTIIPKNVRKARLFQSVKHVAKQFYNNSYFRRHTKAQLTVTTAEVAARCIGYHSLYMIAREYLWPYIPTIVEFLRTIDWLDLLLHMNVGFILGMMTTGIGLYCKRKISQTKGSVQND